MLVCFVLIFAVVWNIQFTEGRGWV